jgi:hypothetical protein
MSRFPVRKGITEKPRLLTAPERDGANKIQDVLRRFQEGDEAALSELARFRSSPLRGDLAGWTEVDLLPDNPAYANRMRMIVRVSKDGTVEARLLQMHGKGRL